MIRFWGNLFWGNHHLHCLYVKCAESSLRGARSEASATKQSKLFRHTERSEVSKTRESNKNSESRAEKRINELDSNLQHCDLHNLDLRDLDSSLRASHFAQNDEFGVDCFDFLQKSRNDEVVADSQLQYHILRNYGKSHAQRLSLAF